MILLMLISALTFLVSGVCVLFKGRGWFIMLASAVAFVVLSAFEVLVLWWSHL